MIEFIVNLIGEIISALVGLFALGIIFGVPAWIVFWLLEDSKLDAQGKATLAVAAGIFAFLVMCAIGEGE